MRYRRITLENFLIFKGVQVLEIPEGSGAITVYGQNGKGKTSLLNAFRWAWTGQVRKRGASALPTGALPNQHAVTEAGSDPVKCRVRLEFEVDGVSWDLTRTLTGSGETFSEDLTVVRDNVALSLADAQKSVAELMPLDVVQFYLFDGELLDQYEKLLDDDSASASTLRDAIERILGLPILENAAKDSRLVSEEAGKLVAKAAKNSASTQKLGSTLESQQTILQQHRANYEREDARARELEAEQRELEEQMAEEQGKLQIKQRRDVLLETSWQRESELGTALEAFEQTLAESWRAVLVDPVDERVQTVEDELADVADQLSELRLADALARHIKKHGDETCPTCHTHLEEENRAALRAHLQEADGNNLEEAAAAEEALRGQLRSLRASKGHEHRATLRVAEETYLKLKQEIEDIREDIADLNEKLGDNDAGLTQLVKRSHDVAALLVKAKEEYSAQRAKYDRTKDTITNLEEQIRKTGAGQASPDVYRRQETGKALADLFEKTIDVYRERVKDNVQDSASDLFQAMRSEPDFKKLVINDSYGLRILDSEGRVVVGRSAGYEHLVALALLGGLQASSPIRGPIVMDSPFGRLDEEHVNGVVANVNKLSSQVFLLVHERELPRDTARDLLRGRLLAEFELARVNSRETAIREVHQ